MESRFRVSGFGVKGLESTVLELRFGALEPTGHGAVAQDQKLRLKVVGLKVQR